MKEEEIDRTCSMYVHSLYEFLRKSVVCFKLHVEIVLDQNQSKTFQLFVGRNMQTDRQTDIFTLTSYLLNK
jgi:hypothetical protein